jgi:hypothetical protein
MIRKLKVGEVIREGDFFTGTDNPNDDRFHYSKYNGLKVDTDIAVSPIFREIPDHCSIKYKERQGYSIVSDAVYFTKDCDKESVKYFAKWLLEVAEFIEDGEQL